MTKETPWDLRISQLEKKAQQDDDYLPQRERRELYQIKECKRAYLRGYKEGVKQKEQP